MTDIPENVKQGLWLYRDQQQPGYEPNWPQDPDLSLSEALELLAWVSEQAELDTTLIWKDNGEGVSVGVYEQNLGKYIQRRKEEMGFLEKVTAIFSGRVKRSSLVKSPETDDPLEAVVYTIDAILEEKSEVLPDG